jgi:hypothetical protein
MTGAKVVTNWAERGKKALRMASRFEAAHRAFPLTWWLMGVLSPIVEPFVLAVLDAGEQFVFGSTIAGKFICNQHAPNILTAFEELSKELLRDRFVPSALNQNIQNMPLLVDRAPQIVQSAFDFEKDLIKMPFVAGLGATSTQLIGRVLTEFSAALTNRLVGENHPACSHKFFHIAIAEGKALVEPDHVADNLSRKAIAHITG